MSEATKSAVLAKCQDVAPNAGHQSPLDANKTTVLRVNDRQIGDRSNDFQIDCWKDDAVMSVTISDETHSDSYVWGIAAEILQIIPTVDEFEAATTARQYAHDLEQARKEGYEAGKAATLWPAYLAAATRFVGVAGINILNIEELAKESFDKWVKTLPPDGLQADRELVASCLICSIDGVPQFMPIDNGDKTLFQALKRLCGLGVGNG